jgi:glycosyltransferase involved in cell wall biosynthesis
MRIPNGAQNSDPSSAGRRVRVLTLIDGFDDGGAEKFALLIAKRLDPDRYESTLSVSRWNAERAPASAARALEELEQSGVGFLPLGRRAKADVWIWARLARFLRAHRVDIVHAHKFGSNVWGTLMGRLARVPVIVAHEHSWSYEGQALRRFLDRELVARGADRLVAISREDQRRMIEVERIAPERTAFIPIGLPALPTRIAGDVRAQLGIAPEQPVIGSVALLRPQKAHHVLIRAVATLVSEWPDLQVLLVGDGPEHAALERLAAELGVSDAIRFLGYRNDVPDVLRALDVAVSSSDFEGSPAAILEYMDASLPVVATAVGGVPDLIESGTHGLLVPAGDPTALASAIAEILRDRERGRAMGERGRERRHSEFGIDTFMRRLEDLYVELLERRRPELARVLRSS